MTGRTALVAIVSALACGGGFNPTDPIGSSGTLSERPTYIAVADNSVPLPRYHTKCPPDTVRCGHSCCDFDSICVNGACCVPPHCPLATR